MDLVATKRKNLVFSTSRAFVFVVMGLRVKPAMTARVGNDNDFFCKDEG